MRTFVTANVENFNDDLKIYARLKIIFYQRRIFFYLNEDLNSLKDVFMGINHIMIFY